MNEPTMETLARRLEKVERENRQWKAICTSVIAVLALAFLLVFTGVGQTKVRVEDEVRAKRFVLVNKNNEDTAELASYVDGSPWFSLNNEGAEISLIVDSVGPRLSFWSKDRLNKIWLTIEEGGSPRLSLSRNLVPRAVLSVTADDGPSLNLYDKNDKRLAALAASETGVPALYLAGQDGVDRAWLEVAGNSPQLVFRDKAMRQRVVLGGFTLWLGPEGKIDIDKGVPKVRQTSSLVLINENGKVIWSAP